MAMHYIKYNESRWAYYAVEAESEQEALNRFEDWRANTEEVYTVLDNSDHIDADFCIVDDARVYDDCTLTDEDYRNGVENDAWHINEGYIEDLWEQFGDVPLNYQPDQYPDDEPLPDGVNEDTDPDGELAEDWFIFKAGTPKMEIWHWFDKMYYGGIAKLMKVA